MWTSIKKLNCMSSTSKVSKPKPSRICNNCFKPKSGPTSCESTFKDEIHGNKRFQRNAANCSPMSSRSNDLINPVTHNVRFTNSGLRMTRDHNVGSLPCVGSLCSLALRLCKFDDRPRTNQVPGFPLSRTVSGVESGGGDGRQANCRKCGESLARQDAEVHHLSKHAVTEVHEEDPTRKIIEMIFKTGWKSSINRRHQVHIERILKVHNSETKLAHFEEYREMVKFRANSRQYSKKHPRSSADGNELLRFYGTTLACRLGENCSSSLCTLKTCNVCCILRHGFSSYKELDQGLLGVFTTSTSEKAYNSIEIDDEKRQSSSMVSRKALILCRVIAGRVHKPMMTENSQEFVGGRRLGFDSLAGNMGSNSSHIEELYVLNSSAFLPCFVIVCKP